MVVCRETMQSSVISQGTSLGEHISGVLRRPRLINSGDNQTPYTSAPVKRRKASVLLRGRTLLPDAE